MEYGCPRSPVSISEFPFIGHPRNRISPQMNLRMMGIYIFRTGIYLNIRRMISHLLSHLNFSGTISGNYNLQTYRIGTGIGILMKLVFPLTCLSVTEIPQKTISFFIGLNPFPLRFKPVGVCCTILQNRPYSPSEKRVYLKIQTNYTITAVYGFIMFLIKTCFALIESSILITLTFANNCF